MTLTTALQQGRKLLLKLTNTIDYEDDTATEGGSSEGVILN